MEGPGKMNNELQIALVSGPAYDPLYESLAMFTATTGIRVNVAFTGDHPALNHHLAELEQVPYDLVSTHTKYAPSQRDFLAPLNGIIDDSELEDFAPMLLELATFNELLYGLPRNIDVRLLHYRNDLITTPPSTWDELCDLALRLNSPPDLYGFVFPGRESGLFGTFYELAEMAGAHLFRSDLVPDIENDAGRWALGLLQKLYSEEVMPSEFSSWHYEEVHECFRSGHAAMVCDWPGYYSLYQDESISAVNGNLGLSLYPTGPAGKSLTYGGGHTFALTKTGAINEDAVKFLLFLTAFDQQLVEARNGCVPVRRSVMQEMQGEADEANKKRLAMLERVITEHILIPPKFARYPEVEEVLWRTVQSAIVGETSIDDALRYMRRQVEHIVRSEEPIAANGSKRSLPIRQTR
ncbi:MAG: ABC transporter substrate-binding protein [Acidobacteria bacterium]|nr:MAG: ABC transporter substrate-binding protein [Acidobacteriota bacterium]